MFFDALEKELKIRNFSQRTVTAYLYYNRDLVKYCRKDPTVIAESDIKDYLWYLLDQRHVSAATARLATNAIKFYYRTVKKRRFSFDFGLPRGEKKLPVVLSRQEIARLLASLVNPKHRLILSLMYSAGLRVSEVVVLKPEDFDLAQKILWVRRGKGNKDRQTVISDKIINDLAGLLAQTEVGHYLFKGQKPDRHLSSRSAEKIFSGALLKSGIKKRASCHSLRHSFATHLLEAGVDAVYIQKLLGHKRIETTLIYARISNKFLNQIKSPFDQQ
jgi:integrase/recombinase XerD